MLNLIAKLAAKKNDRIVRAYQRRLAQLKNPINRECVQLEIAMTWKYEEKVVVRLRGYRDVVKVFLDCYRRDELDSLFSGDDLEFLQRFGDKVLAV